MPIKDDMLNIYAGAYERYGNDPRSFWHNDQSSQLERFSMLGKLFAREAAPFTVHEIGCSVGHFGDYLQEHFPLATYSGSDIYFPFVEKCRERFPGREFLLRDVTESLPDDRYDYVVTCGTFNIAGNAPRDQWQAAIYKMAAAMYALATKGMGMTFLTIYHDPTRRRADLFYQDERSLMDFVVNRLSRHFELDEIGPLYEYGLRVFRPEHIRSFHREPQFAKYFNSDGTGSTFSS